MTFWKFIQNYPQAIAVALALVVPTLARIFRKLSEQSAKRSAGIRREQQELESLRTGRAPVQEAPQQAASARATLEEMAAKRRAQIEELRQRRQTQMNSAPAQQPAGVQATAPVTRPAAAGRPQQTRTAPADRRPFQAAPPGLPTAPSRPAPAPVTPDQRARIKGRQETKAREQAEIARRQRAKQQTDAEHQRRVTNQQRDRAPRMTQQAAATAAATNTVESVATAKQELAATTAVARIPKRNIVLAGGDWAEGVHHAGTDLRAAFIEVTKPGRCLPPGPLYSVMMMVRVLVLLVLALWFLPAWGVSPLVLSSSLGPKRILTSLQPPTPQEAAKWAIDPYDADKRYRGTLLLANCALRQRPAVYPVVYRQRQGHGPGGAVGGASRGLGTHGRSENVLLLIERLADEDPTVRVEAARALQRIHNPVAIDPLLAVLRQGKEQEAQVRMEAACALGQYAENRVVEQLIQSLQDDNLAVNRATQGSLRTLTGQDFGLEFTAWQVWYNSSHDLFAARGVYVYPVFFRKKTWVEHLPMVPGPPNEPQGIPAGLVPGGELEK